MADSSTRPRDAARTRGHILTHARREFARVGYTASTVRGIARAAGVSPNLITRYFGGKEGLFVAAGDIRLGVGEMIDGPRGSIGARMADAIVGRWTSIEGADPLLVLLRSAGEHRDAADALANFLDAESLEPLRRQFVRYGMTDAEADDRARAIDVFLLGVSARMRVLRDDLGPADELREWIASAIQRLVDGA
ncbi:MAG: TetR family transcriptional regulator [Gordonia paraffinivorans]